MACFDEKTTCRVRAFDPNSFGVFGLTGGVSEWGAMYLRPEGPFFQSWQDGDWHDFYPANLCVRNSHSNGSPTDHGFGFRCVSTPKIP